VTTSSELPLVSIVIPCYNQGHFLCESIASCRAQTYPHCEVIVVDDGSTDDTAAVSERFPATSYHYQRNQGLAAARNAGIRAAQGSYVAFLDADDRLKPHAVETNLNLLLDQPALAMVSGDHCYIDRAGHVTQEWTRAPVETNHYRRLLEGNYIGCCSAVLFRRAVFDVVGGFDPRLAACEDYDLYLRIARQYEVGSHAVTIAEYRRYPSTMSDDSARMLTAAITVLRRQQRLVRGDENLERSYRTGLAYWQSYYGAALARELARGPRGSRLGWLRRVMTLLRYAPRQTHAVVESVTE
jgi:glycosyltransferase involved in cell wall biosynthesis